MKKWLALLLAALLLLSSCGTKPEKPPAPDDPSAGDPADPAPEDPVLPEDPASGEDELAFLRENFPRLDGSTSLIPLEAGIRAAIFGLSMEEAQKDVVHSTTWGSFSKLLEDQADMIFSTPISEEQETMALEAGVALEQTPIVREAFVFVVNAKNPVDTLTQQQIRDIYSGKITNWKELGGEDEPIVAFQRNTDSGSQNYMLDFMGDTPLMDAPEELRPASMSGLMSVIAPNDGSLGSIGYSVYAYAADMYGLGDNIKFIRLDGVAPSKATMISEEYPLTSFNYAIYRADAPEDGAVRRLANWITSYDGQLAIAKAGYATLEEIGFDYPSQTLAKYSAAGTGMEYPGSIPSYEYIIPMEEERFAGWSEDQLGFCFRFSGSDYDPSFLTDPALRQQVRDFIEASAPIVTQDYESMQRMIRQVNSSTDSTWLRYEEGLGYLSQDTQLDGKHYAVAATVKNGYLSVAVTMGYTDNIMDGYPRFYRTETAVWDLLSGRRLAPEELFYQGVDIAAALNDYLSLRVQQREDEFAGDYRMKTAFAGLTEQGWHLTADAIYFDQDNPYFACGYRFSLRDLPEGLMVTEQPRDMSSALNTACAKQFRQVRTSHVNMQVEEQGLCSYALLKEGAYPGWQAINRTIQDYMETYCSNEAIYAYYAGLGIPDPSFDLGSFDYGMADLGGKYILLTSSVPGVWVQNPAGYGELDPSLDYPHWRHFIFDAETGQELQWTDLLQEGWQDAVIYRNENRFLPDERYVLTYLWNDAAAGPTFVFQKPQDESYSSIRLCIPSDYIRW